MQEFLEHFPDEDTHTRCEFFRGQGEALWRLGRQAEAEAVFASAIERLHKLYQHWDKPQEAVVLAQELAAPVVSFPQQTQTTGVSVAPDTEEASPVQARSHPSRNDLCWCGSGKKYKHCHRKTDRL